MNGYIDSHKVKHIVAKYRTRQHRYKVKHPSATNHLRGCHGQPSWLKRFSNTVCLAASSIKRICYQPHVPHLHLSNLPLIITWEFQTQISIFTLRSQSNPQSYGMYMKNSTASVIHKKTITSFTENKIFNNSATFGIIYLQSHHYPFPPPVSPVRS